MKQTAKFWVSLVGALAGAVLTVVAPDSQVAHWCGVVVSLAAAFGVWLVPNAGPKPPAGVTGEYVGNK